MAASEVMLMESCHSSKRSHLLVALFYHFKVLRIKRHSSASYGTAARTSKKQALLVHSVGFPRKRAATEVETTAIEIIRPCNFFTSVLQSWLPYLCIYYHRPLTRRPDQLSIDKLIKQSAYASDSNLHAALQHARVRILSIV